MREAAHRSLSISRDPGLASALQEALASGDLEVALRARAILAERKSMTHVVVDALSEPIPEATVILTGATRPDDDGPGPRPAQVITMTANAIGMVALPPYEGRCMGTVWVHHRLYGLVQGEESRDHREPKSPGELVPPTPIAVPLVAKNSPAYAQALRGQVVGPDGKGVRGAEVTLSSNNVRAPNFDLINSYANLRTVYTDEDGQFAIYPCSRPERREGICPVPPRSRYEIRVCGADIFPHAGKYANTDPVVIRVERPQRFHRFEFESPNGGRLTGRDLNDFRVAYGANLNEGLNLGWSYVRDGGKLVPGLYAGGSGRFKYQPLEVTKDSPEVLLFRLPKPPIFRGRVVDAVTGKPMPGAFVVTYSGLGSTTLATLKDADWAGLEALPSKPPMNSPALKCLNNVYSIYTLVRTDEQGRYEIKELAGTSISSHLAFARDRLAYGLSLPKSAPGDAGDAPSMELPLFPAARVAIHPITQPPRTSLAEWTLSPDDQSQAAARFRAIFLAPDSQESATLDRYMGPNRPQTFYVPAEVRLTLVIHFPPKMYNPPKTTVTKPVQLPMGGVLDLGQVEFK